MRTEITDEVTDNWWDNRDNWWDSQESTFLTMQTKPN